MLSRVIWGAQTALLVIVVAVVAVDLRSACCSAWCRGYFGGWLDRVLVVIADAIYAFPSLLLAIVMAIVISGGQSSLWGGIFAAAISITVVFVPQYFRVVRAEAVRIKAEAFVESAKVIGAGHWRIMTRHVLRNATRTLPLIVTLNASEAILTLAGLGFLGFGIEPTAAAEWGYDLEQVAVATSPAASGGRRCSPASRSCWSCSASPWSARASTTSPTRGCAPAAGRATAPADAADVRSCPAGR